MCTVTYIPADNGCYLSSNRDESHIRSQASAPEKHMHNRDTLLFPADPDAGGTWIILKSNGDAAVLLNGAFQPHVTQPSYRKSRGLILMDLFFETQPSLSFEQIDLEGIAPFTLILFTGRQLEECRWDGFMKHKITLDSRLPQIWSSVTLYTPDVIAARTSWFKDWLSSKPEFSTASVMHFHRFAGNGDQNNDLVMNRDGKMTTVSITSIFMQPGTASMTYQNLKTPGTSVSTVDLPLKNHPAKGYSGFRNVLFAFRKVFIKLFHWEYWPLELVYAPVLLYWFWLSLKARSFFFFSAANPSILNSGFAMSRKSSIYQLIPQRYYPKTLLFEKGMKTDNLLSLLNQKGFSFPLMVKPDIGERGVQVKLLHTTTELLDHIAGSQVDFLIQEFIGYTNEAGIFYYRIPGQARGHISGIVGKEFLAVTGDGVSSIKDLILQEDRFVLQLPVLKETYGEFLDQVLPVGVYQTLVPYGSHNRGAKFTDLSYRINDELVATIDQLCRQLPDFYYGRLDLKFNTWESLNAGKDYFVIEINGAASEPTHMYDPSHTIFFAWGEIIRHWRLLYQISLLNAGEKGLKLMSTAEGLKMIRDHQQYLKQLTSGTVKHKNKGHASVVPLDYVHSSTMAS